MATTETTISTASTLPPLISVEKAAELLGISRWMAYRAASAGDIPTLRWGRRVHVPTARLLALVGLDGEDGQG